MPRFHFHVCTVCEMVADPKGREFPDLSAACRFARRYAQRLASEDAYRHIEFKVIEVRDHGGLLMETVPFTGQARRAAPPARSEDRIHVGPSRGRTISSTLIAGADMPPRERALAPHRPN